MNNPYFEIGHEVHIVKMYLRVVKLTLSRHTWRGGPCRAALP